MTVIGLHWAGVYLIDVGLISSHQVYSGASIRVSSIDFDTVKTVIFHAHNQRCNEKRTKAIYQGFHFFPPNIYH